jgi:hypothetical protein
VQAIAKITPADYPDLLAAVDAGMTQRELARRYDCVPSLIARHVSRAKRARELSQEPDPGLSGERHSGSTREILQARIRDPKTSARDLASLVGALGRLEEDAQPERSILSAHMIPFPDGALITDTKGRKLFDIRWPRDPETGEPTRDQGLIILYPLPPDVADEVKRLGKGPEPNEAAADLFTEADMLPPEPEPEP